MSRRARPRAHQDERDRYLAERGVRLLGGGAGRIAAGLQGHRGLIAAQADLVDIVGRFCPRVVRMADEPGDV